MNPVSLLHVPLLRQGVIALLSKLAAAALSYVMFALLARWLGSDDYGQYASAFSAGTFLSYVVLGGLHTDVLRSLPAASADDGTGARRAYLVGVLRAVMASIGFASLMCLLAAGIAVSVGQPRWVAMILLAFSFAIGLAVAELFASILRALGSVSLALLPRDVVWRTLVIGAVLAAAALGVAAGLVEAVVLSVSLLLIAAGGQLLFARHLLPRRGSHTQAVVPTSSVLWNARWLAAAALAGNLLQPLAVVVVGATLSFYDSGSFFAAQKTAALLSLPLIAMNMMGAPAIARSWATGDREKVQRICTLVAVGAGAATLAGFAVVASFAGPLLGVFDPAYRSSGSVLVILAGASVANALAGPTAILMQMTGREKHLVGLVALGQGTGLLLVGVLGTLSGQEGAAWGLFAGTILWNGMIVAWSRRSLHVDPSALSLARRSA